MPHSLEVVRPILLGGLVALPVLVWYFHDTLTDFALWQRVLMLVCRTGIVLVLVLALCGLTLLVPTTRQYVVFAVDTSLSIGADASRKAAEYVGEAQRYRGENETAFVVFGGSPGRVESEFRPEQFRRPQDSRATNLAAAIEVAAASIPHAYVPQVVLLSDGNATEGDTLDAVLAARVPVSVIPLPARGDPEVQVAAVEVPSQVRQGEPFYIEVVIDSNHEDQGTIEIFEGPHKIVASRQKLALGENRFRFRRTIQQDRVAEFTASVRASCDTFLDNNVATGLVFSEGRPRVLAIEGQPKTLHELTLALEAQDLAVDVRPPEAIPDTLSGLQNYDALVLGNVPATALSLSQMAMIRTYVEDLGGGLVMLGGDQSFGLGGYYRSVLEDVLPVRCDFELEKERPSLAMILILDKSRSMSGIKMDVAKDAARGAIELLAPHDQIGVYAFDGASYGVCELQDAGNKFAILDRIGRIQAGGGTRMAQPLLDSYEALSKAVARLKHVVLLTDGLSQPDDFEAIAAQMAMANITLSTVAIGEGAHQALLENLAQVGKGRFYACKDPYGIPQIFAKETITATRSALCERPTALEVVEHTQVLDGLAMDSAPPLLGYVITRPKTTSEVILASETGDPILAWWRFGLGMTVAFTSDATSRWSAEWLAWPDLGRFWAQVIRHALRASETKGTSIRLDRQGDTVMLSLDVADFRGQFVDEAETLVTVVRPDLGVEKLPMPEVAPGRYAARFQARAAGSYHLELVQARHGQALVRQTRGLVIGYPDELRIRPTNQALLRQVAEASGGNYDPKPREVFADRGRTAVRPVALWPYLVMAAAGLFAADVALRRIDLRQRALMKRSRAWQTAMT